MGYRRSWGRYGGGWGGWAPYVPVAKRRAQAAAYAKRLAQQHGRPLSPVKIDGRAIAKSFWGKAWCDNLEAYGDFANRLPRGRTYVRNGSVIDLEIAKGKITALVSGREVYKLTITIASLPRKVWQALQRDCADSISSLIDLLQGRFDRGVMERLARKDDGLFPKPNDIQMECSCPDYAGMCKHIAAVMYGVGARLDRSPELLFTLRNVDHLELVSQAVAGENLDRALATETPDSLRSDDLGEMFGIELETGGPSLTSGNGATKTRRRTSRPPKTAPQTAKKPPAIVSAVRKPSRAAAKTTATASVKPVKRKRTAARPASKISASAKPNALLASVPRARRTKPPRVACDD
ncbi:MAG: SWIM zinc finger family protein [Planctomycetaceae bacterium]